MRRVADVPVPLRHLRRGARTPPEQARLSADGRHVLFYRRVGGDVDVWSLELGRDTLTRLTFDPADDVLPIWSPDRTQIVFSSNRTGRVHDLYLKSLVNAAPEECLLQSPLFKHATDWSRDGKFVMFRSQDPKTDWDLWALRVSADRQPFALAHTSFDERDGQFSPDGKWIAYQSNESGRFEIYVQPFPGPGAKTIVSTSGGAQVRWRSDGKELFYIALDGRLMAVPMQLETGPEGGRPVQLFATYIGGAVQGIDRQQYMVAPDGSRFLMNAFAGESVSAPITLVLNWAAASQK
jgi:Tol biopolymer transport system component